MILQCTILTEMLTLILMFVGTLKSSDQVCWKPSVTSMVVEVAAVVGMVAHEVMV